MIGKTTVVFVHAIQFIAFAVCAAPKTRNQPVPHKRSNKKVELKQQHRDIRVNLKKIAIDHLNRPVIFFYVKQYVSVCD